MGPSTSPLLPGTTASAHLDTIAARLALLMAGAGATQEPSGPVMDAVAALDGVVDAILKQRVSDELATDFGNLAGKPLEMHSPEIGISGFYLQTALELARAYRCPWSKYYGDPTVQGALEAGMRFFEGFVRPEAPRQGTWYGWDIAIPRWLSQLLVLCGAALSAELRHDLVRALEATPFQLFQADVADGIHRSGGGPVGGGANTMEVALHLLVRAVVTGDERWACHAHHCIPVAMGMAPDGEGVQRDWSFHFHGHGVNATYGHICMASQAQWIYLTQGTPWQCDQTELDTHFGVLREFFTQNAWRGRFALHTLDRAPARPGGIFGEVMGCEYLLALLLSLQAAPDAASRTSLATATQDWLLSREAEVAAGIRDALNLTVALLENEVHALLPATIDVPVSTRLYPESSYLIARRPNWFAAALTSSPSCASWKSINGEHVHGSSSAEFSVVLMTDGREVSYSGVPTMDWSSLMGVTRCKSLEAAPEGYGQSPFTGSISSEALSVMSQQYLLAPPAQSCLRANKSLFVTQDAVILVGTNIQCEAHEPVWTTLFHAPLEPGALYRRGPEFLITGDRSLRIEAGETLYLRNVCIQLLEPAILSFETRSGSYLDMNHAHHRGTDLPAAYHRTHQVTWVYLRAQHGTRPRSGKYGAVLWPGVSPDFVPPTHLHIRRDPAHHGLQIGSPHQTSPGTGAEVRFPGDWRPEGELSYFGAEPAKWGNLALWHTSEVGKLALTVQVPLRFLRQPQRATEILLPAGMEAMGCPAVTLTGEAWPKNIWPCMANGQPFELEVTYLGH